MKNAFLLPALLLSALFFTGCDKDPDPLSLDTFDVRWYDDDQTGTQTPGDVLSFDITISTTDNDPDDQVIREWEFSYTVNGQFAGVLIGDENADTNTVGANIDVEIGNLLLPGPGQLHPGDVIEFRLWAIDNHGTELEQFHRYVLE
ncbi:MAG TPA: hypothetical protein PLO67_20105 [Saprospiraceae bacterium]|nr:hypothetical protein [Saprospiraceae bacterium]HPI05822.1 hypothetical protein [Saprospiraceae bacterium]